MHINLESLFNEEDLLRDYELSNRKQPFKKILTIGDSDIGFLGTHMTTKGYDLASIIAIFKSKQLFNPTQSKPIFLDLGCGLANVVIYAAHHGWISYGVDSNIHCYNASIENIGKAIEAEFISEGSAKVAYGNFFPPSFVLEKMPNYEKEDPFRKTLDKQLEECPVLDVYASQLNLRLSDVDLFYHFQVERQNNILRFFSEYGKRDAMLLILRTMNDTVTFPPNIKKIGIFPINEDFVLYQKI